MFSADSASHAHATRPKRSRQAAGTDDSVKLPQAKRKRSALRRDTFEPLAEASINEIAGRTSNDEKVNGHAIGADNNTTRGSSQSRELTVRGGKKVDKRHERGAENFVLSKTDFYNVAQLPALPEQIRSKPTTPYSCTISPEYGYALALSHTDAVLWTYTTSSSVPSSRDLITFKLPFHPASMNDPLPLAEFTSRAANGEPGLVVVSAREGKAVYWDTITNASSVVPGQISSGVQGSVGNLLPGETIASLVNAEPAGFILTFSHGRVAHLTVRDQMGRPHIGVQYLRKSAPYGAGAGIFGTVRSFLGTDRRKGVPFVKAAATSKAQREIIIGTEDGDFEFWTTNLTAGNSLQKSINVKAALVQALRLPGTIGEGQFKILDFEITHLHTSGLELATTGTTNEESIVLLTATTAAETSYNIIELSVSGTDADVRITHPIKCYKAPLSQSSKFRPQLCVSPSHPIAFVLFESAVVIFSLAKPTESPSTQLLAEKQALPEPFQDCIQFQEDSVYKVLTYVSEDHDGQASVLFAIQGFGLVRMTSLLKVKDEEEVENLGTTIGAKSKIEQAVFYGTNRQNPLDLNQLVGHSFNSEEIQSAVLQISFEILSSTTKYLPKTMTSFETLLKMRAKAMDDLVQHVLKYYPSSVTRETRFQLFWNAEKLAAAQAIWKTQEEIQRKYPSVDREMSYLDFTLRALHESRQKYPEPEKGEKDRVRHWLANSAANVAHLLVELSSCLRELEPMLVTDPVVVTDYLTEAADLWNVAYSAVYSFRDNQATTYGLEDEVYVNGVLQSAYPLELEKPWTSSEEPYLFGQRIIYDIAKFLDEWWEFSPGVSKGKKKKMPTSLEGKQYGAPQRTTLHVLASRLVPEVDLFSRIIEEEHIQAKAIIKKHTKDQDAQKTQLTEVQQEAFERRRKAVQAISPFDMPGSIQLAEKFRDPDLLVTLTSDYIRLLVGQAAAAPDKEASVQQKIQEIQDHTETYYDKFGNDWAYANFSRLVENGELGSLLTQGQLDDGKKQSYVTWFLKHSRKRGQHVGKVSWINDIIGEQNFSQAEKTIRTVALKEETDLWNQQTELCLGKLAGLATAEERREPPPAEGTAKPRLDYTLAYDRALSIIDIQDSLAYHVSETCELATATDAKAAQELVQTAFLKNPQVVKDYPFLKRLLKKALSQLIAHQVLTPAQLIDILTLIDPSWSTTSIDTDHELLDREFLFAIRVVEAAEFPEQQAQRDVLRAIIWRRCMIRDDWNILNETAGKGDSQVEDAMKQSALFRTLFQVLLEAAERGKEVKLFTPEMILDTHGGLPDSLAASFNENELAGIRKDLEREQERLKGFVGHARLAEHFGGLLAEAEAAVREVLDQVGEEMAEDAAGPDGEAGVVG